ncbi:hypothetical protein Droror1_Dr00015031 [Drosera rotundifolia]
MAINLCHHSLRILASWSIHHFYSTSAANKSTKKLDLKNPNLRLSQLELKSSHPNSGNHQPQVRQWNNRQPIRLESLDPDPGPARLDPRRPCSPPRPSTLFPPSISLFTPLSLSAGCATPSRSGDEIQAQSTKFKHDQVNRKILARTPRRSSSSFDRVSRREPLSPVVARCCKGSLVRERVERVW